MTTRSGCHVPGHKFRLPRINIDGPRDRPRDVLENPNVYIPPGPPIDRQRLRAPFRRAAAVGRSAAPYAALDLAPPGPPDGIDRGAGRDHPPVPVCLAGLRGGRGGAGQPAGVRVRFDVRTAHRLNTYSGSHSRPIGAKLDFGTLVSDPQPPPARTIEIRAYRSSDRPVVRRIAYLTGLFGSRSTDARSCPKGRNSRSSSISRASNRQARSARTSSFVSLSKTRRSGGLSPLKRRLRRRFQATDPSRTSRSSNVSTRQHPGGRPLSLRARRSLLRRWQSTPSAQKRPARGCLRRASLCR